MKSIKTRVLAPIAVACTSTMATADDHSGAFNFLTLSDQPADYVLRVPRSALDNKHLQKYLPTYMNFDIHRTRCLKGGTGYRWNGGHTSVGSLSWSLSTAATASVCSSTLRSHLAPVKLHALHAMEKDIRDHVSERIYNAIPNDVLEFAIEHGYDPQSAIDQAAEHIADYIMDPNSTVPSEAVIRQAFNAIPSSPHIEENGWREDGLQATLEVARHINRAKDTLQTIHDVPQKTNDNGTMLSLGWESTAELRYHFAPAAHGFVGAHLNASANASINKNPFSNVSNDSHVVIPFYGHETTLSAGVRFNNVASDLDLAISANIPFSDFSAPYDGVTIEKADTPYWEVSARNDDALSIALTYQPKTRRVGFTTRLEF